METKQIVKTILPDSLKDDKKVIRQTQIVIDSIVQLFLVCPGVSYNRAPMFIRGFLSGFFTDIYRSDNGKQ